MASPLVGRGTPLKETDPCPLLGSSVSTMIDGSAGGVGKQILASPGPRRGFRGTDGEEEMPEISVHLTIGPGLRKRVLSLSIVTGANLLPTRAKEHLPGLPTSGTEIYKTRPKFRHGGAAAAHAPEAESSLVELIWGPPRKLCLRPERMESFRRGPGQLTAMQVGRYQ